MRFIMKIFSCFFVSGVSMAWAADALVWCYDLWIGPNEDWFWFWLL